MHRGLAIGLLLALSHPAAPQIISAEQSETGDSLEDRISRLEAALEEGKSLEAMRLGRRLFARSCAACHGKGGKGDGPAAADLNPPPRDFTRGEFRFRTTGSGEPPATGDIQRTIQRGLPGTAMPAFGTLLSGEEIGALASFVRSLGASRSSGGPEPLEIPEVEQPTEMLVREGRAVYILLQCGTCHGTGGSGRGPSSAGLRDETGAVSRPTNFRYDPFKGGRDARAVVRTLLTGLNGTPMPAYDEALIFSREDVGDPESMLQGQGFQARHDMNLFLRNSPSRARLERMNDTERLKLRTRRLTALAHYVLSLDRRQGLWYRFLRQEPEKEGRAP